MTLTLLLLLTACSSSPTTAPPRANPPPTTPPPQAQTAPAWLEDAVTEALDWEVMPGTTDEPDPTRTAALRAFFTAHPEYADPQRRAALADPACAMGTEAAHAYLQAPHPPTPQVLALTGAEAGLLIIHAQGFCTSDDWAWFTSEVSTALSAQGIRVEGVDQSHDAVLLQRDGVELVRVPLTESGYFAWAPGKQPLVVAHSPTGEVLDALRPYFGLPTPAE